MFVEITTFDDGNDKLISYSNQWEIIKVHGSGYTHFANRAGFKFSLRHYIHQDVIIESISGWKFQLLFTVTNYRYDMRMVVV